MDIPKSRFSYHDYQTWLTVVIFIITWIQIAKVPLPKPLSVLTTVGRTLSVLLSSSILVLTNVITPDEAFAAQRPETLILLAGLMVLLGKFEEKGIIMMVRKLLVRDGTSPIKMLVKVSLLSGFSAMIFMNDGAALFLANVVNSVAYETGIPVIPYAMAVATSANIGSVGLMIGNPKTMIIREFDPTISFLKYCGMMIVPATIGILLNTSLLVLFYRKSLAGKKLRICKVKKELAEFEMGDEEDTSDEDGSDETASNSEEETAAGTEAEPLLKVKSGNVDTTAEDECKVPHNIAPKLYERIQEWMKSVESQPDKENLEIPREVADLLRQAEKYDKQPTGSIRIEQPTDTPSLSDTTILSPAGKRHVSIRNTVFALCLPIRTIPLKKIQQFIFLVVLLAMYVGFFAHFDLAWTCTLAVAIVLLIDQLVLTSVYDEDNNPIEFLVESVNWGLLIYLFGIFIIIEAVKQTPIPNDTTRLIFHLVNPNHPVYVSTLVFTLLVLVTTLVFTSVPVVLLLAPFVLTLHENLPDSLLTKSSWYQMAWATTISGNVTAFSSVAGLIVSEICGREEVKVEVSPTSQGDLEVGATKKTMWIGDLGVWCKFGTWSSLCILVLGTLLISLEIKVLQS